MITFNRVFFIFNLLCFLVGVAVIVAGGHGANGFTAHSSQSDGDSTNSTVSFFHSLFTLLLIIVVLIAHCLLFYCRYSLAELALM